MLLLFPWLAGYLGRRQFCDRTAVGAWLLSPAPRCKVTKSMLNQANRGKGCWCWPLEANLTKSSLFPVGNCATSVGPQNLHKQWHTDYRIGGLSAQVALHVRVLLCAWDLFGIDPVSRTCRVRRATPARHLQQAVLQRRLPRERATLLPPGKVFKR
jgi:hypothetical protein